MDEGRNKIWYLYAMEHYTALKRDEIPSHATTWVNLRVAMLSEIS